MSQLDWEQDTSEVYPLGTNRPKGIAAIFYVEDGAYGKADFNLLDHLWNDLECDVRGYRNPDRPRMDAIMLGLKTEVNANPGNHSFFSLTFIGHGGMLNGHEFLLLANNTIYFVNDLYNLFSKSDFQGLTGKPVHIFLQVCRPAQICLPAAIESTSQWSDLFILHSSFMGTNSYFDDKSGKSPFIETICEVFKSNFRSMDIQKMGTLVKRKMNGKTFNGYSQTVTEINTLTKTFYFDGVKGKLPQLIRPSGPNNPNSGFGSSNRNAGASMPECNAGSGIRPSNRNAGASTSNGNAGSGIRRSNRNAGASTSNGNAGSGIRVKCGTCGTVSRTTLTVYKKKDRGRKYYNCGNCGFIVWNEKDELDTFLKAQEKEVKCKCNKPAPRGITSKGPFKGKPYYHCKDRSNSKRCGFFIWENDLADS